ncbi:MAG: HNH endonuclease [Rhizobiales bacterium]|nr:HNH endonuclease [Hyphomicrobiales bacterium]
MPKRPALFRPHGEPSSAERVSNYNDRRGSSRERGYDTRWDDLSRGFRRANPLCLGCQAIGRVVLTDVCDHVIPHRGDRRLFWDPANRQPACNWHHSAVKQTLERMYDDGEIAADQLRLDSAAAIELTREMMDP